jgi:hypothetical protein
MEKLENIIEFKAAIIKSIERPKFLIDLEVTDLPTPRNLAWNGAYNILSLFSDGISKNNLTKAKIRLIAKQIDNVTNELDTFLDSKQLLLVWSFVGQEVDIWIELAIAGEYFETAANLKKIMEAYFND